MLQFGHIELFVKDPQISRRFYEDVLDFELVTIQHEKHIWLKSGAVEILLRPGKQHDSPSSYQDAANAIVLYTEDVETTAGQLRERGMEFLGTDGSPGCLTFVDPDGHWFQLVNPAHP